MPSYTAIATCPQQQFLLRNASQLHCKAQAPVTSASCGDVDRQLLSASRLGDAATPWLPWHRHRVALCFYSLTRSLRRALPSIERSVILPLFRSKKTEVEIFLHTYNLSVSACTGCSSGSAVALNWRADVAALARRLPKGVPLHVQVDDQSVFIRRLAAEHTTAFATKWRDDGVAQGTAQYYLAAMLSLKRVTAMWRGQPGNWHMICVMRPDLVYLDPLPHVAELLQLASSNAGGGADAGSAGDDGRAWLLVPPRQFKLGKSNLPWVDDKFAIASPSAALLYGNRVDAMMVSAIGGMPWGCLPGGTRGVTNTLAHCAAPCRLHGLARVCSLAGRACRLA